RTCHLPEPRPSGSLSRSVHHRSGMIESSAARTAGRASLGDDTMKTAVENAVVETAASLGVQARSVQDPSVVEAIGRRLAERLSTPGVGAVVSWDDLDDAVLGHVVARELGGQLSYAYVDEGILGVTPVPESGTKVVVVGYELTRYPGLGPLLSMLR